MEPSQAECHLSQDSHAASQFAGTVGWTLGVATLKAGNNMRPECGTAQGLVLFQIERCAGTCWTCRTCRAWFVSLNVLISAPARFEFRLKTECAV